MTIRPPLCRRFGQSSTAEGTPVVALHVAIGTTLAHLALASIIRAGVIRVHQVDSVGTEQALEQRVCPDQACQQSINRPIEG